MLFALSIYIFFQRLTPGRFYIVATCLFFILATVSVVLDLVMKCTGWVGYFVFVDENGFGQFGLFNTPLQSTAFSIFVVSG